MSCIGISNAAVAAVTGASVDGSKGVTATAPLPEIQRAIPIRRALGSVTGTWEHHACKIIMTDGTDYVFDWFPTLDAGNPWVYQTADWRLDQNPVVYSAFSGFA